MGWIFWLSALAAITIIFWRLWVFAGRIEDEEAEEQAWLEYIEQMWYYNPEWAQYYQQQFEERFYK